MARCKCDSNGLYSDSERIFARDISISYRKIAFQRKEEEEEQIYLYGTLNDDLLGDCAVYCLHEMCHICERVK